jgi:beta-lactamase class A
MTLETLASLMISISDNTATDNLLKIAGKENVQKMLAAAGHSKPEVNIPFLSTVEMFKLKGSPDKGIIQNYLSSTDKNKFLNEDLLKIRKEDFSTWSEPAYIDKVEWFASVKDLCTVMNWIRINSENEKSKRTRNILSINPGLGVSKEKWSYTGYKGGSEPGVMNMTYLLCSAKGEWFVLSCTWNNTKAPVDEAKFSGLVGRAIQLLEK